MSNHPTGGTEPEVPIPPPTRQQLLFSSAAGGFLGAAAGAMLIIWLIGCCCDEAADTRTGQVGTVIGQSASEPELRLG